MAVSILHVVLYEVLTGTLLRRIENLAIMSPRELWLRLNGLDGEEK